MRVVTVDNTTMTRFMRERGFGTYEELWTWSVQNLEEFWAAIWEFFGVDSEYETVLQERVMPGASCAMPSSNGDSPPTPRRRVHAVRRLK